METHDIFAPTSRGLRETLDLYQQILKKTFPLSRRQRDELPANIRSLSHGFTDNRTDRERAYLAQAKALGAYLYFFVPWNLYRQTRLFSRLKFVYLHEASIVIDLGSGPLTAVIALWIAQPTLRPLPLKVVCVDKNSPSMQAGLDLLRELALKVSGKELAWRVSRVKAPLGSPLRERGDLVIAANVINELEGDAEKVIHALMVRRAKGGRLLIVEPGTPPSAEYLVQMRSQLIERGDQLLAPCPHIYTCPFPGTRGQKWCHFSQETESAPEWLIALSKEAKLPKENAALSFMYSRDGGEAQEVQQDTGIRVISEPIKLPDGFPGYYSCHKNGILLVKPNPQGEQQFLYPGDWLEPTSLKWLDVKDPKTRMPVALYQKERKRST